MYAERHTVTITTDASGDATAYSPVLTGRISNIVYVKDDFATGVDFAITLEATGLNVWTKVNVNDSAICAPRQATHGQGGAESLYAAAGEPVEDYIVLANDRIKFVIAQGGDTKTGVFHVTLG